MVLDEDGRKRVLNEEEELKSRTSWVARNREPDEDGTSQFDEDREWKRKNEETCARRGENVERGRERESSAVRNGADREGPSGIVK